MCGIVGYIGQRQAEGIILSGLQRLEYRGYDSSGIAILNGDLQIRKVAGKVEHLRNVIAENPLYGTTGIGHTRWATHGEPNQNNAHPHIGASGSVAIVHNGIVENSAALKKSLEQKGRTLTTHTDTEVIVQLIEDIYIENAHIDFEEAVQIALQQIHGTYGVAIIHKMEPDKIIAARKGSPLLLGVGENEMFIASDASPIIEYTSKVIYLDEGEMAVVRSNSYEVKTIDNIAIEKEVHQLSMDIAEIEKKGYPHFMLKEIFEQPDSIADCMRGRINLEGNCIQLGGLVGVLGDLMRAKRIIIAACGTSWHSALVGEYLFERLAHIPVEVEYASEFRYRDPIIGSGDVLIVISQSGETADTLAAVHEAQRKGALVLGICNVVGSSIARQTDAGVYTHAGPEIGVASTKAFTAQVTVLAMMAILLAHKKQLISDAEHFEILKELNSIPDKVAQILDNCKKLKEIASLFTYAPNFLYMGRTYNFPVALEGALKLKEISYIHAEGYPAAEMKHGPIALIDKLMPVVIIAATVHTNDKVISNIEEVKARGGRIISITSPVNTEVIKLSDFSCIIPETIDCFTPLLSTIPLQLLSYYIAVNRGCNVDQPRNLAKSVTVE